MRRLKVITLVVCVFLMMISGQALAGNGKGAGNGPGDGTGTGDRTGDNGPGDCKSTLSIDGTELILAGNGKGAGNGPGDGTGTGDRTGDNGPGDCKAPSVSTEPNLFWPVMAKVPVTALAMEPELERTGDMQSTLSIDGTELILAGNGKGAGNGPGDGTGTGDRTGGNGPGDC